MKVNDDHAELCCSDIIECKLFCLFSVFCRFAWRGGLSQWALLSPWKRASVPPLLDICRAMCWAPAAQGVLASGCCCLLYVPTRNHYQQGKIATTPILKLLCISVSLAPLSSSWLDSIQFQSFSITMKYQLNVGDIVFVTQCNNRGDGGDGIPAAWFLICCHRERGGRCVTISLLLRLKNVRFDSCEGVALMTHSFMSVPGQSVAWVLFVLHFWLDSVCLKPRPRRC